MRILAVCGSLQSTSKNLALLGTAARCAPPEVDVVLFDGIGDLPHFNPDIETTATPDSVQRWRHALETERRRSDRVARVRIQPAGCVEERN